MKNKALVLLLLNLFLASFAVAPSKALAVKWTVDTHLTTDIFFDGYSSLTQTRDGKIWVVWQSNRIWNPDQSWKIFYKIHNGSSWTKDNKLNMNETWQNGRFDWWNWHDVTPAILQVESDAIWIVWSSNRTGNYDIFYKVSYNNGLTWTNESQLTTNPGNDNAPAICQTKNGTIWLVWQRKLNSSLNYDLFSKKTLDYGLSWSKEMQLTTHPAPDKLPSIIEMKDGKIWVVWQSLRQDNFDIYYRISSDHGATWTSDMQLTTENDLDMDPAVCQTISGRIWIIYTSRQPSENAQDDLYYKTSEDGQTWLDRVQLTHDKDDDLYPSIAQSEDRKIWIAWTSDRALQADGNPNIYCKTSIVLPGDITEDGTVDIYDLSLISIAYKKRRGDSAYNPAADLNNDGYINIWDLQIVARHYGENL